MASDDRHQAGGRSLSVLQFGRRRGKSAGKMDGISDDGASGDGVSNEAMIDTEIGGKAKQKDGVKPRGRPRIAKYLHVKKQKKG